MRDLHDAVTNALFWDYAVPRDRVTAVVVEGGLVILHGEVEETYQKSCAEADVRRVDGVLVVLNEIDVRTTNAGRQPPRETFLPTG
jgi:osmotically-inducible protein OsmY